MRDQAKRQGIRRLAILVAMTGGAALTACAHNDVLVFGTSTTIGLNVQTASTQGAAPSIVLGFEREEAVWMPLLVNGNDTKVPLCPTANAGVCPTTGHIPIEQTMYRSTITTTEGRTQTEQADAYSVFASLGATFNGRGNATDGAAAGGGLAQFFATGNAAINVSRNPALVTALKVESGEGAAAQAQAVAATTGAPGFDALAARNLTAAQRAGITEWLRGQNDMEAVRLNHLQQCARDSTTGLWRWPAIVADMVVSATFKDGDKADLATAGDEDALKAKLMSETEWQTEAARVGRAKSFC